MAATIDTLTDATFDEIVGRDELPYLVDFWAPWCGRCRLLEPAVTALAEHYAGRLRVGRLDVDASPGIAARFDVMSLPTVIVLDHGKTAAQLAGVITPVKLREAVGAVFEPTAGS